MKKGNTVLLLILIVVLALIAIFIAKKNTQKSESAYQDKPLIARASVYKQKVINEALVLEVISPMNGEMLTSSIVTVRGRTVANAEVLINDKDTKADAQGNFLTTLNLDEGENIINIVANDSEGKSAEKELTVTFETQ